MFSLFRKKNADADQQRHLFSFVPDGTSQKVLGSLADKTDLYPKTVKDLRALGQLDRRINKYETTSLEVEIVSCPDGMKVVYGKKLIGYVPKRKIEHVKYALENDCSITAVLSGGPYKFIRVSYDDYGHPSFWTDKHDGDIAVKIDMEY